MVATALVLCWSHGAAQKVIGQSLVIFRRLHSKISSVPLKVVGEINRGLKPSRLGSHSPKENTTTAAMISVTYLFASRPPHEVARATYLSSSTTTFQSIPAPLHFKPVGAEGAEVRYRAILLEGIGSGDRLRLGTFTPRLLHLGTVYRGDKGGNRDSLSFRHQ